MSVSLTWYLIVAAGLFSIGLFGVLSRRNAIGILMGIELMLNAVSVNLVAFWRFLEPEGATGQAFALFVCLVATAEAMVGLALILVVLRTHETLILEDVDWLKG